MYWEDSITPIYCRVPEGWGLHKTARPPGRNETRSVNPLVRIKMKKTGPTLDIFKLRQGEPQYCDTKIEVNAITVKHENNASIK